MIRQILPNDNEKSATEIFTQKFSQLNGAWKRRSWRARLREIARDGVSFVKQYPTDNYALSMRD
jgi:hypothetical protein